MDEDIHRFASSAFIGLCMSAFLAGLYGWLIWVYSDSSLYPYILNDLERIESARQYEETRIILMGILTWGFATGVAYIAKGIEFGKMAKIRAEVQSAIAKRESESKSK
ncbi:MAG: hypothetical protein VXY31_05130 [Candidatus Thermoplasmatota archaeon]|nr:hypothetical protein [Candidatus Thermoplasmatota archaeon]